MKSKVSEAHEVLSEINEEDNESVRDDLNLS